MFRLSRKTSDPRTVAKVRVISRCNTAVQCPRVLSHGETMIIFIIYHDWWESRRPVKKRSMTANRIRKRSFCGYTIYFILLVVYIILYVCFRVMSRTYLPTYLDLVFRYLFDVEYFEFEFYSFLKLIFLENLFQILFKVFFSLQLSYIQYEIMRTPSHIRCHSAHTVDKPIVPKRNLTRFYYLSLFVILFPFCLLLRSTPLHRWLTSRQNLPLPPPLVTSNYLRFTRRLCILSSMFFKYCNRFASFKIIYVRHMCT